jgi:hypothetical protein
MASDESENANLPLNRLPQERYVRIIGEGMRFHGVDDDYIDFQIMNVPYIPNCKPEDYMLFPPSAETKTQKKTIKNGKLSDESMGWFIVGKRVIEIGEHDPKAAFVQWAMAQLVGKINCTWVVMQTLYDADLPVCG